MPTTPVVFCLHGLGLSARAYDPVREALGDAVEVVAIDLPGFGDEPASSGVTVEDTVACVIEAIRARMTTSWLLVGHSMGGKIASIVAARTMSGAAPLFGLAGVVLLAASPPSPEPMDEDHRASMLSWARSGPVDAGAARTFVDGNVGAPLSPALDRLAIDDVQRASRAAWLAWLSRGSLEDWSREVGRLDVPALIVGGDQDDALGAEAQPRINGPVYSRAGFVTLAGAGHLLTLERPAEVAEAVTALWEEVAGRRPIVPEAVGRLIASNRVSARTRAALAARALADSPRYLPQALTVAQLDTLRAVADRVVPQHGDPTDGDPTDGDPLAGHPIDLAARLDARLAAGAGDGWRFADMPPDVAAYRSALDALAGFERLSEDDQDRRLAHVATGDAPGTAELTGPQLSRWFEDARDDLVRIWLAHPATMARIGFDGFANGGDTTRKQGFALISAGDRDSWEPRS